MLLSHQSLVVVSTESHQPLVFPQSQTQRRPQTEPSLIRACVTIATETVRPPLTRTNLTRLVPAIASLDRRVCHEVEVGDRSSGEAHMV